MTKYLSFKQAIQVLRVPRVTRSARDSDLFIELSGTPSRPASTSSCCPSSTNLSLRFFPSFSSPLPTPLVLLHFHNDENCRSLNKNERSCLFLSKPPSGARREEISRVNTRARLSIFYPTPCYSTFSAHGQNLASFSYITYISMH